LHWLIIYAAAMLPPAFSQQHHSPSIRHSYGGANDYLLAIAIAALAPLLQYCFQQAHVAGLAMLPLTSRLGKTLKTKDTREAWLSLASTCHPSSDRASNNKHQDTQSHI
jgi:hypothetical protein